MVVKIKNAAGSDNVGGAPIYMPANGLAGQQFDTLFGKPVIPIEQAEALGTKGDILLCDLSEYLLIRKGALETAESIHVRFLYGENTFRFTYRINGAPAWKTGPDALQGLRLRHAEPLHHARYQVRERTTCSSTFRRT